MHSQHQRALRTPGVISTSTAIGEPHLRNGVNLAYDIEDDWPWIKLLVSSGEPGFRRSYLPRTASYLPKPWHALDLLIEAERAVMGRLPASRFHPVPLDTTDPAASGPA